MRTWLAGALTLGALGLAAQAPPVFSPLLADPKEPQFFATYLWTRSPRVASRLGSVGFGQTIALVRGRDWDVGVAAGVFSQFNMASSTTDLLNTDYLIGIPVAYRRGTFATRIRVFHQSSHLGDEYMAHTHAQRVDLTFEAVDLLVAHETPRWRAYGGGDYVLVHSPSDLKPLALHGGLEYHQPSPLLHFGRFTNGRLVAGVDAKSLQDRKWQVAWSVVSGLELGDPAAAPGTGWRWSVLIKAYTGPAPYGEFYRDRVSSVGLGIGFTI